MLNAPLDFKHFAATQTFGGEEIDMRAEVGLLSRNVRFRGDPGTSLANEYGATNFLHSMGDDSLTAKLAYIEMTDVGQAFKLGRYALHFHMIGNVHNSYVKGNSVHQGFNRAFTFHGTSYLRLEKNVVFNVKGHNIFIEDAVERHNQIHDNLVMMTKRSWSLLNTDQTPASFWITNPDNDFTGNHAAGSDRYSYWYDLQIHAMGPSANNEICPENEKVGIFDNNHAHSNGRYGLRIFHNMVPRTFPCKPIVFDASNPSDPYWQNPLITANFNNLVSWKNKRNGAIAERVGDVRFNGFKTADNILAGIEFSLTAEVGDFMAQINNALIVGKTDNTEELLDWASPHGIITPRTENFVIDNVRFHNYNWNDAAGIGSCSHCFHPAATDSGARTVSMKNLVWDDVTVTKRLKYQYPYHAIYFDLDGSLTGKGPNTWATPYKKIHEQPECETLLDLYDGVTCDSTIQVRRLSFNSYAPKMNFDGMQMVILRFDDNLLAEQPDFEAYKLDRSNYAYIAFKDKSNPANSWTLPFVTGHKYKIHWGNSGIDYEKMNIDIVGRWEETDKNIIFMHNYTDVRAIQEVNVGN